MENALPLQEVTVSRGSRGVTGHKRLGETGVGGELSNGQLSLGQFILCLHGHASLRGNAEFRLNIAGPSSENVRGCAVMRN